MTESLVRAARRPIEPVDDGEHFTKYMELLQVGYVSAVAATAGCTVEVRQWDLHKVDVEIIRAGRAGHEEVPLLAQLKCTTRIAPDSTRSQFGFRLKRRDYLNDLTLVRSIKKKILIVMLTSPRQANWTSAAHDSLAVQHCCYWVNLEGDEYPEDVESPTFSVNTSNVFDAKALAGLMEAIDLGRDLPK